MEIYWHGHGCFRIRGRDATVITDPCPPATGYKLKGLQGDMVTISREAPDSNYRQAVAGEPKFVSGAGEYEIASVLFSGVRTDHDDPAMERRLRNVAYVFDLDDIRVCHLGSIDKRPSSDVVEALGGTDILLLPVGGGDSLDAALAAETVTLLEPKLVIPMRYKTDVSTGDLEPLDRFLKGIGAEGRAPEQRLTITRSALPADTTVVVLNYRS